MNLKIFDCTEEMLIKDELSCNVFAVSIAVV